MNSLQRHKCSNGVLDCGTPPSHKHLQNGFLNDVSTKNFSSSLPHLNLIKDLKNW